MKCLACRSAIGSGESLKCVTCKGTYHYSCLNITSAAFRDATNDQKRNFNCPSCTNVTRRGARNDNTPIKTSNMQLLNDSTMSCEGLLDNSKSVEEYPQTSSKTVVVTVPQAPILTLKDISALLDEKLSHNSSHMANLRSAIIKDVKSMITTEINGAISELKADFTTTTDFLMEELGDVKNKIQEKDDLVQKLEKEKNSLQVQITSLNNRIEVMEKMSRDCNVEIQCVPEQRNENTYNIFKKICESINVPILDADIRACRRVAKMDTTSKRPRNIIITLNSPRLRDNVLSAAYRYNKRQSSDKFGSKQIGFEGENQRIYFSEHLSPEMKRVHAAARKYAKENNYLYVWVKFGQVYLRKNESSTAVRVKNIDCLKNLK